MALWNGNDPILKERLFGLTNGQGNHGEDVKEQYFYLDATPTYSYIRGLYRYPQAEFPYEHLAEANRNRSKQEPEYELIDTGIFDDNRYFDIFAEYAKASDNDLLIRITVHNRAEREAILHLLPTIWFRNTWIWGCRHEGCTLKPNIKMLTESKLLTEHETLEKFVFAFGPDPSGNHPDVLFTENETNSMRLFGVENYTPYTKDAFGEYVIRGFKDAVNKGHTGTKAAPYYILNVPAQDKVEVRMRLFMETENVCEPVGGDFDAVFERRISEMESFYKEKIPSSLPEESRSVIRQAYAGLLWSKQFYHYIVEDWLKGDPNLPTPAQSRLKGRNADWPHLFNRDVVSVSDKWEYPWYASWDMAFHMICFARIDPDYAKKQLLLFLREWYMHPNGQIPAYEFAFSDVNPPVHAWACWQVYKMTDGPGKRDRGFLESAFQKLLLNFTWWVNRKDPSGKNVFSGGFLGLDNIGIFDRSRPLESGGQLNQADGTAWMAFYCVTMLSMALELAQESKAYEDMASKFFEHFVAISDAMNTLGGTGLWDEADGFYYDQIQAEDEVIPLKIRSLVGLLPLIAVEIIEQQTIDRLPGFRKRMQWFLKNRRDLARHISYMTCSREDEPDALYMLAIPSAQRLKRLSQYLFDEKEFLSEYGIRSLSRIYEERPFHFEIEGRQYSIKYLPGESDNPLFGGNSNWRGPIWFPINYVLIEALERYDRFYGRDFLVEFPTGSGKSITLGRAASEIAGRLTRLFLSDANGHRPLHGGIEKFATDENWKDLVLFYEYFNPETGRGLGAGHQTGWTALAARFFEMIADSQRR